MTGTAMTEQEEFYKIYGLEVVSIPTHRPMVRDDSPDLVFRDEDAKFNGAHRRGRRDAGGRPAGPRRHGQRREERGALEMLKRRGVRHEVLNAKFHEKEAPIVAQAGRSGAVTIATNMAGRGTDILLGGNPAGLASSKLHPRASTRPRRPAEVYARPSPRRRRSAAIDHDKVVAAGGLHIIGTERHDARRIDNQLRGRAGRQGDPGSSRFYLSLEDTLMKRFASDRVTGLMERMGLEGDVAIESRSCPRPIENAQSRVEGYNFDIRKRVVEYDDVINKQRETIYAERDKVLRNEDLSGTVAGLRRGRARAARRRAPRRGGRGAGTSTGSRTPCTVSASTARSSSAGGARRARLARGRSRSTSSTPRPRSSRRARRSYGAETWALVERAVLLRAIDPLWVDHLTELDDFRRGVGLRGYGGTDPLVEFKREAFKLYEELRGFIRHQVAATIFRVNVQRRAAASRRPRCRR